MTVHLERNRYAIEEHFVQKAKEKSLKKEEHTSE
jgi:hypothetical protein